MKIKTMKTNHINKVMIALDYDPTAQKVAEVGYTLAKSLGAEIILLHVVSDPIYYSTPGYSPIMGFEGFTETVSIQLNSMEALKNASLAFLERSKQHLGDDAIQTLVTDGDSAESILKAAKENHADIIVMGSHSRRWLDEILMGSVTEKVLHHTSIPLYIVPTKNKK